VSSAFDIVVESYLQGLAPEPELTVDAWADLYRILAPEEAREHGPWRTDRVPFWRELLQRLSVMDPTRDFTVMKPAQMGGSQVAATFCGYIMANGLGPAIFYCPSRELVQDRVRSTFDPMIDNTEVVRNAVATARSRNSSNSTFNKRFKGGMLRLRGANSGNAFRQLDARFVIMDDLDGFPIEVGDEGDPVTLASNRAATYDNAKFLKISTPTYKGGSLIEREFLKTDQRHYFLPCPHCNPDADPAKAYDWIRWENIRWDEGQPETAALVCLSCGAFIDEDAKTWMLEHGEWRPTAEGKDGRTGYHLSAMYAPIGWTTWADLARAWQDAQGNPLMLKAFINTKLAETYEDRGSGADADPLMERLEPCAVRGEVPNGVGILTAGVDVHDDRFEISVWGWGVAEESWLIEHRQIFGDPVNDPKVWFELDQQLLRRFTHESGRQLRIECAAVDSGGHATDQVYRFCKARRRRRVFAVKGDRTTGRPIVQRPSLKNQYRTPLFMICTDTAKETVYRRLNILTSGPGFMHFPAWVDLEYMQQLTAERGIWKTGPTGIAKRKWEQLRERNEALDCCQYALSALRITEQMGQLDLPRRARALAVPVPRPTGALPAPAPTAPPRRGLPPRPRRKGWVGGWGR
jgi:phage terminase large subunit GpA-like protein